MATWHYFNKNGEKVGPISVAALKALTEQGLITRETVIVNHTGRTAIAGEVRGLTFPTPPPVSETVSLDEIAPISISPPVEDEPGNLNPPVTEHSEAIAMQFGNVPIHSIEAPPQSEVYGLTLPEQKKESPAEPNPFTAEPPAPANPFTTPVAANPFTGAPASCNPFAVPMPNPRAATPQSMVEHPSSAPESVVIGKRPKPILVIGIAVFIIGIAGLLYFGIGTSRDPSASSTPNTRNGQMKHVIEIYEKYDKSISLEDESVLQSIYSEFCSADISKCTLNFQDAHKKLANAMLDHCGVVSAVWEGERRGLDKDAMVFVRQTRLGPANGQKQEAAEELFKAAKE